jgi:hypothetical protein
MAVFNDPVPVEKPPLQAPSGLLPVGAGSAADRAWGVGTAHRTLMPSLHLGAP